MTFTADFDLNHPNSRLILELFEGLEHISQICDAMLNLNFDIDDIIKKELNKRYEETENKFTPLIRGKAGEKCKHCNGTGREP